MPRGRKPSANSPKNYFTIQTQQKIIQYNLQINPIKKQMIYQKHIHDAFSKIVNALIYKYKFYSSDLSLQDLKNDTVSFMYMKMHKFQNQKGKAFSYFSVIAKNYLVLLHKKIYAQNKKFFSLDKFNEDVQTGNVADVVVYNSMNKSSGSMMTHNVDQVKCILQKTINKLICTIQNKQIHNIEYEYQHQILSSIVQILKSYKTIDILYKKALYFYIKQITNYNYHKITVVLKKIKPYYQSCRVDAIKQYHNMYDNIAIGQY